MATPEQIQQIKVETAKVLLENDGQGIAPKTMKPIDVGRAINEKSIPLLEDLSEFSINLVIQSELGPPFSLVRFGDKKISIESAVAATNVITDVHERAAVHTTECHAASIQDAADVAQQAIQILEEALAAVKEVANKARAASDLANASAETARSVFGG